MFIFRLTPLIKAYIHGHYRLNRKTGERHWVDSYTDKRPERGRTEFAHWTHRKAHFEHHLAHGRTREALHAFHDLGHDDSHKLAAELGLHDGKADYADKKTLMGAIYAGIGAKRDDLKAKIARQVKADWERRKQAGQVGNKRSKKAKKDHAAGTDHASTGTVDMGRVVRPDNTAEQPYQSDKIKLSRSALTRRPATDQLPDDLARHLKPHAKDAVNLATEQYGKGYRSFLIADGTGAGKTRQALAVAEMQRRANPDKPILIVTQNARVVNNAFAKDAATMGVDITPVDSLSEVSGGGIYVATYTRVGKGDFDGGRFQCVIMDEAHNLKNYTSKKTAAASKLIKSADRSLLLTATPGDKPEHIGYLASAFGFNFIKAMSALGYTKGTYGMELNITKAESLQRMGSLFDDFTRRGLMVKREVSMDNIDVSTTHIDLGPADAANIEKSHANMLAMVAGEAPQRRGLAKMLGLNAMRTALEPYKIDATVEAAAADVKAGKKVVVFANRINDSDLPTWWSNRSEATSVGTLDALAERLEARGIKVGRLYGKHLKRAQATIGDFQDGDNDVVIATPQAGGTGINLDDAKGDKPRSMLIMTAPFSSLEAVQQIGRINRLTTQSRADVKFIQANGVAVDTWNHGIIAGKLKLLGATVQGDVSKLNLDGLAHVSDEDLAKMGASNVPVEDGLAINLADVGLPEPGSAPKQADTSKAKTYLRVPYDDKERAKKHGARWDRDRKQWYVHGDVPPQLQQYHSGGVPPAPKESTPAPRLVGGGDDQLMYEDAPGTASYKGRRYKIGWQGKTKYGHRTKLQMSDGREFWVDTDRLNKAMFLVFRQSPLAKTSKAMS